VRGADFVNKKIKDIMTKQVAIATLDDDLDYAINAMKKDKIRHIPIADDKRVVGIISMRDILGFRYEETKSEIRYIHLLPKRSTVV
jgi:CBS domain-containing protein